MLKEIMFVCVLILAASCGGKQKLTSGDLSMLKKGNQLSYLSFSEKPDEEKSLVVDAFTKYDSTDEEMIYNENKKLALSFFKTSKKGDRPLILFLHPGGFLKYNKDEALTRHMCRDFARAGYHTATASYSLISKPKLRDFKKGTKYVRGKIADAIVDVADAITFLSEKSEELNIDTKNIFMAGFSAGGFLTLHSVFSEEEEINDYISSKNYKVSYKRPKLRGAISIGGALLADHIDDADTKNIPILMFHGQEDKIVPIGYGQLYTRFIEDARLELPDITGEFGVGEGDEGYQLGKERTEIFIPKWLFEFTLNATTSKVFGSRTIFDETKGNIHLYEVKGGRHTFMVNSKGILNTTYREMRQRMLDFIILNKK